MHVILARREKCCMVNRKNKEVYFAGISGHYYQFVQFPIHAKLPEIGAVYIFIREHNKRYDALYIGETDTFNDHFLSHDKWVCASRWFINGVCFYFEDDPASRLKITRDLILKQKPICNDPI